MLKYRNKPTVVDGIRFASKKESVRYKELKFLERVNEIKDLDLQPRFEFPINGEPLRYSSGRKVTYFADFSYKERHISVWTSVIEDVKGIQTPVFKLKAALMKAVHGIEVRLT